MYRNTFLSVMFLACCFNGSLCAQSDAQIYERTCDAKTYPFSDPSPVATPIRGEKRCVSKFGRSENI